MLWLAVPGQEVIFRARRAVREDTLCDIAPCLFQGVPFLSAVGIFLTAASGQKVPLFAFCPIREDADAGRPFLGLAHFQFVLQFLAVNGSRIGHAADGFLPFPRFWLRGVGGLWRLTPAGREQEEGIDQYGYKSRAFLHF